MITSIVLAGGKGKRLGRAKLSEKIGGCTLCERAIDRLVPVSDEILVVVAQGQPIPDLPASAKVLIDLYPDKGALGGIYTGLVASSSFHNLVVACDMPFLNPALLRYLIQISPGFDAVIPRDEYGRLEPLHVVYSKNCIDPIHRQLQQDNLKINGFLDKVRVRYVGNEEVDRFDQQHLSFFNINTQADLEKARDMLEEVEEKEIST